MPGTVKICSASLALSCLLWAHLAGAACTGGPQVYTCDTEAHYRAKLAALGFASFDEGFEDPASWGDVRSPDRAPAVTSQQIVWTVNHPLPNAVTTGTGAAFSGRYGVYDALHGSASGSVAACDVDLPAETCLYLDGFGGRRTAGADLLYGVGGYIRGSVGAKVELRAGPAGVATLQLGTTAFRFIGVIDTAGFESFRVRELEGKIGQKLMIFGDHFVFGIDPTSALVSALQDAAADGDFVDMQPLVGDHDPVRPGLEVVVPRRSFVDADGDGYPEQVALRYRVYPLGERTALYDTAVHRLATPSVPADCAAASAEDLNWVEHFHFDADGGRLAGAFNIVLDCFSASFERFQSRSAAVYSARVDGSGGEWHYAAPWQLTGSGVHDTDGDAVNDTLVGAFLLPVAGGTNQRTVALDLETGAVVATADYPHRR